MAIQTISQLKAWFKKGLFPTESQFSDWMDSYWHKSEKMTLTSVDGLADTLNSKAETTDLQTVKDATDTNTTNITSLQNEHIIDLGFSVTRTAGKCYIDISAAEYDKAMLKGRFIAIMRNDFSVIENGTQSDTVKTGYEPVYIRVKRYTDGVLDDSTTLVTALYIDTTTQATLKDIYGKAFYVTGSLTDSNYLFTIGIQQETEVPATIVPANATVIAYLQADYAATADTAANVNVLACASGATFTLPAASTLTQDKNIKLYLSKNSGYSISIVNGTATSELKAGGYAELFYSNTLQTWTVTVTNQDTDTKATVLQSFLYFKVFTGSGLTNYYKLATIKSTGDIGKHFCSFKIFSGVEPQNGVYNASFFLNLRKDYTRYYGGLYCTSYKTDSITNFTPKDIVVTYDGNWANEVTTTIWKRANNASYDSWYMGVDCVAEAATLTLATNSFSGEQEQINHKPATSDGYDFVIDCQYDSTTTGGTSEKIFCFNATAATLTAATQLIVVPSSDSAATNYYRLTKDWTPTLNANNEIIMPSAGILCVDGFVNIAASGGTTAPREAMVYLTSGNTVKQVSHSANLLFSTSTDNSKWAAIPLSATIQVAAGDTIKVVAYTASNSGNILGTSQIRLTLKS